MAAPGALIADRYRLVREIGAGGMGVVWEARDERLARSVAVKQLRSQPGLTDAEGEVVVQRAMREARITARLQHPYAVSVFDVVEHEGKPCIVMELVPSVPLSQAMRELGTLSPNEAARVGSQVAAALTAAHALGIVHRDVKPGNVLIGDDGAARICDFGISRSYGDTTLTMTGMITGTPAYLAPESARGQESTSSSDVYSLGATLYAAVEGVPPSGTEGNAIAVLYRVAAGELRPPERAGPLGPLLMAMMSADPSDRPTMAEAALQLSALAGGETIPPARPGAVDPTLRMPAPEPTSMPDSAPTPVLPPVAPPEIATRPVGPVVSARATPSGPAPAPTAPTREQPTPQQPTPAEPTPAPASGSKRRRAPLAAIVIMVVLALVAVVLLWPNLQRWTAGSDPSPAGKTSDRPASESATSTPTGAPTTAELTQAVTDYYGLLPDDTDAAWELLTDSYQRQTGGRDSYEDFWGEMDSVTVTDVSATTPDRAQATITYVEKSGNRKSTERRSFRLIRSDGVLKINQSSVL
jgi:serine/threonine protein kinase